MSHVETTESSKKPVRVPPISEKCHIAPKGSRVALPRKMSHEDVRRSQSGEPSLGAAQIIWRNLAPELSAHDRRRFFMTKKSDLMRENSARVMKLLVGLGIRKSHPTCIDTQYGSVHRGVQRNQEDQRKSTVLSRTLENTHTGGHEEISSRPLLSMRGDLNETRDSDPNYSDEAYAEFLQTVEIACDNDKFVSLCLVFDEEIDPPFEMIALTFLEENSSLELEMSALVRDILIYSHWRSFGIKNATEHLERASRLLNLIKVFKEVRKELGLPSYEEERIRYLREAM